MNSNTNTDFSMGDVYRFINGIRLRMNAGLPVSSSDISIAILIEESESDDFFQYYERKRKRECKEREDYESEKKKARFDREEAKIVERIEAVKALQAQILEAKPACEEAILRIAECEDDRDTSVFQFMAHRDEQLRIAIERFYEERQPSLIQFEADNSEVVLAFTNRLIYGNSFSNLRLAEETQRIKDCTDAHNERISVFLDLYNAEMSHQRGFCCFQSENELFKCFKNTVSDKEILEASKVLERKKEQIMADIPIGRRPLFE